MPMATAEGGEGAPLSGGSALNHTSAPEPAGPPLPSPGPTSATANAKAVADLPMADKSYDELSLIGNGAYGTVYLGRDKSNEGRLVALKKIRITLTDDGVPVNALREIALLKKLEKFEHPNIVRLLDICHGLIERENRLTLILVFEYVEQDLDHYLKNCPSPGLEAATIKTLMHQVLCGVDFLHQNRIIHRDLKPQNLLVDRYQRVKIADFGLARIYDFNMRLTTMVVTLWYRAPEVLLSNSYATPVDVWSCGCIFAELYKRTPLFEGKTEGDQLQRIFDVIGKPLESEWPKDISLSLNNFRDHVGRPFDDVIPEISPDASDLMRKLLKFVPASRICASEALKHPFFRGLATPRVIASSNRGTPTQQILVTNSTMNRSPTATSSPLRHITAVTNTISNTTISSPTPSQEADGGDPNDENNPNAVIQSVYSNAVNNNNNNNTFVVSDGSSHDPKLCNPSTAPPGTRFSENCRTTQQMLP